MEPSQEKTSSKLKTKQLVMICIMSALLCIIGPLSIPIGPIPVSLTLLGIYLAVYTLGTKDGTYAFIIYLLLGLVGLPVFSGFTGGPAKLFGPTGGYLLGMIFLSLISGWFINHFDSKHFPMHLLGMILGLMSCYIPGTIWFMILTKVSFMEGFATCVFPFLVFDAIKIIIAAILGITLRKALKAAHLCEYKKL